MTLLSILDARHLTLAQFQRYERLATVHGGLYVEALWLIYEHAQLAPVRQAALDVLGRIDAGPVAA